MNIREMQTKAWETCERKGFHTPEQINIPTKLMLIVTEVSEALDEFRNSKPVAYTVDSKPEGISAELADVVIRCGDLAGIIGFDLETAVVEKMKYNETRKYMHGDKKF